MSFPHDSPEEDVRQCLALLREKVLKLTNKNTVLREHRDEKSVPGTFFNLPPSAAPAEERHINAFYKVPKIAPFFKTDPAPWFIQVEASLRNEGITNQVTMEDTVISHLDMKAVSLISDLVLSPDRNRQYDNIKN
ncbi:hypothetical protein PUN28_019705 [Cardiocondyla obscurior]|uniref:DUF7041 domain-containing protein n=1 Tax=Cardiocondyla obscurior TaxID=286306 RepID=A0AAW2EA32_9HYME